MKKFAIWFISCFTCAFAANHDLLLEFNEPVRIRQVMSEYNIVKVNRMRERPMVERPVRMKNGEIKMQMVLRPTHTYNVVIESDMTTEELLESMRDVYQFSTGEPNHPATLVELDAAVNIDGRLVGTIDNIDAQLVGIMDTFTGGEPNMYGQSHTWAVDAITAWNGATGTDVIVAVLDTGIDLNHPFFAGSLIQGYDYVDNDFDPSEERNGLDTNNNGEVDEGWGHGTHVAGVLKSVAPNVKIMPIRVCDSDGQTDSITIANGIADAIYYGADVINMSMSIYDSTQLMKDWLAYAQANNIPVVTSAGNNNTSTLAFPATEPQVITVASVNDLGIRSSFSNYHSSVMLSAPGEAIYAPAPGGGWCDRSGTSMSAPIVAGEVALILDLVPNGTITYVRDRLTKAMPIDLLNPLYMGQLGYGMADLYDAITVADQN